MADWQLPFYEWEGEYFVPWPRFLVPPVWVPKPWTFEPVALGWATNAPKAIDMPSCKFYANDPWTALFEFINKMEVEAKYLPTCKFYAAP